jgi:RIO-like serine/threonine protein kinase
MTVSRVSEHLLRVFRFLRESQDWVTSEQVAEGARVSSTTAKTHLLSLTGYKVVKRQERFPAYYYRLTDGYEKTELAQYLNDMS